MVVIFRSFAALAILCWPHKKQKKSLTFCQKDETIRPAEIDASFDLRETAALKSESGGV